MIITQHPKLSLVHVRGGYLAILKRNPCPGRMAGKIGNQVKHGVNCGCYQTRHVEHVMSVRLLTPDEQAWCLQQSRIKHAVS
jgi:hypothetical protein